MLKRRTKISPSFSMASMTDIIFLLLIFFMVTSTLVSPNAIKVNLPQSKMHTEAKKSAARVTINDSLITYASPDGKTEKVVTIEELPAALTENVADSTDLFVTLYADETVPYKKIVEVLDVANDNNFKMVLATRPPQK